MRVPVLRFVSIRRSVRRMTRTPDDPRIAIPYFTGHGHTRRVAEAVAQGAAHARLIDVETMTSEDWQALGSAEAIVFGTPTYMGSVAAGYSRFLEDAADRWTELPWRDKIAAGFTVATYPSGDKLATLIRLAVYAGQMGMIWVGQAEIGAPVDLDRPGVNRDGSHLGLMATSTRDKAQMVRAEDLDTARRFGKRIAAAALRWRD